MIWTPTDLERLADQLASGRPASPPYIYELLPPEQARASAPTHLVGAWEYRVHKESGAMQLLLPAEADWRQALEDAIAAAIAIDPDREWFRWEDLNEEEHQGPLMLDELVSEIDGTPAIGPGGRIRVSQRTAGALVEIVARPRVRPIASAWRPVDAIVEPVTAAADEWWGTRIRFGFGYHEASGYEEQRWLRPVFVFLLDMPSAEVGTRWRVALVEAATEAADLPPEAGLENAAGRCP